MVAGGRIVHRPAYPARKKYFLSAENAVGPADRSLSRAQRKCFFSREPVAEEGTAVCIMVAGEKD